MHTHDLNSSNVPAFLIKLWKLVQDPTCDDLIAWNDNGASFIIKDQAKFASELLPQYFKHNNMASFVRQLNMYGFRKVMNYEKSGLRNESNEMEFQHGFFVKEQSELLEHIKRKIPNTRIIAEPLQKSNAKDILTDLTSIRDKQENMDNMLLKMKQENELLWKELTNMRQKHKQQEQVIEKVINFLVQVIRNQPVGVGIQRKMPRMLHDSSGSKGNTSQITTVDVVRKKPECIIVKGKNSSGPVIHEITDYEIEEPRSVNSVNLSSLMGRSPASKSSVKSPASVISLSPAPTDENEDVTQMQSCSLDSTSLSSPVNSDVPFEQPLNKRTPIINEGDAEEESVLGIPLEYITTDVTTVLNAVPSNNVISIPKNKIFGNVISIPEGSDIGSVITIPEGTDISNIISIPEGSDISNIINIPEGGDISSMITIPRNKNTKNITIPISKASNVTSIPDVTVRSTPSKEKSVTMPLSDFYNAAVCLDDLKANSSSNMSNSVDSSLTNHDFIDPLMSDSLQTPTINLTDDIDLIEFTVGENNKMQKSSTDKVSSLSDITQKEHDYLASTSTSSQPKSSAAKNTFTNHLLIVDEELNRLQDNIATTSWDMDVDKILGVCPWTSPLYPQLFNSDGIVSNEALVDQLTDGITIKKEPDDILDSEFGQLTPQILGVELEELRSPFLNQLDPEVNSDHFDVEPENRTSLLRDTVNEDAFDVDEFLSNENDLGNSFGKRRQNSKVPTIKHRKLK